MFFLMMLSIIIMAVITAQHIAVITNTQQIENNGVKRIVTLHEDRNKSSISDIYMVLTSNGRKMNQNGFRDSQTSTQSIVPSTLPGAVPICDTTPQPSEQPSILPSKKPSAQPLALPSAEPSVVPTRKPSTKPSIQPTKQPTNIPITLPTVSPSFFPSSFPSVIPSLYPSGKPSSKPSRQPIANPSGQPSSQPSCQPSRQPSSQPSAQPSVHPSRRPSCQPSCQPSSQPSRQPSLQPSAHPSVHPSRWPSAQPSSQPSIRPSMQPSSQPSTQPSVHPSTQPSVHPSSFPTSIPSTSEPSSIPTSQPTTLPMPAISWLPLGSMILFSLWISLRTFVKFLKAPSKSITSVNVNKQNSIRLVNSDSVSRNNVIAPETNSSDLEAQYLLSSSPLHRRYSYHQLDLEEEAVQFMGGTDSRGYYITPNNIEVDISNFIWFPSMSGLVYVDYTETIDGTAAWVRADKVRLFKAMGRNLFI